MGKVGDREVYESSEYDIADRMYVNILFFEKAYSLSKSTLFAHFFIYIFYFLCYLPPANSGYTKFMVYLSFYPDHP